MIRGRIHRDVLGSNSPLSHCDQFPGQCFESDGGWLMELGNISITNIVILRGHDGAL